MNFRFSQSTMTILHSLIHCLTHTNTNTSCIIDHQIMPLSASSYSSLDRKPRARSRPSKRQKQIIEVKNTDEEQLPNNHSDNFDDNNYTTMIPSAASSNNNERMLPAYLAEAFGELYAEDGLAIFGRGLGSLTLLASLVRFYADVEHGHAAIVAEENAAAADSKKEDQTQTQQQQQSQRPPLVLVLGLKDDERSALMHILERWGTPSHMLPTMITNESGQGKDRAHLYQRGGVLCITSRILIVDLLTNTVHPNDIAGLLVAHAETVDPETSTEAFILRIYHSRKQPYGSGFVKAVTEDAESFLGAFARVDKTMKALHVRRLYLFPRFQHAIREELELVSPPSVTECHVKLSPLQQEMQAALAAAVQSCIRQIKQQDHKIQWQGVADLSMENCVTTHFDRAIAHQLEREWHLVTPATKQLIADLRTLRTLFQQLIVADCVSFWNLLNNLKTTSAKTRHPSLWLLTPAADLLFRRAKQRVYTIQRVVEPLPASTNGSTKACELPMARLVPVLEENPKWKLLKQILAEIKEEYDNSQSQREKQEQQCDNDEDLGPTTVLVMVNDDRTVEAVKSYLVDGKKRGMMLRWLRHLESINDRSRSLASKFHGKPRSTANNDVDHGSVASHLELPEEDRLLLEEEGRVRRILFGTGSKERTTTKRKKKLNEVPDYLRKRRRVAQEKGRGKATHQADDLEREAALDDAVQTTEHKLEIKEFEESDDEMNRSDSEEEMFRVTYPQELRVIIKSYSSIEGDESSTLLYDIKPQYIILYDADVAFIRAVEIYSALHCTKKAVRVFFLVFEASAEEKTFAKALEREKNAFERLIQHKKTMPPPMLQSYISQEMQQAMESGTVGSTYMGGSLPLAFDSSTRRGRGKYDASKERRDIAVDVREFRSALPSILHQKGMRLAPVTLTVGDFVLSSVHCVERKSISDLFGSFASGRLFSQAEAMCKYYTCPCLLIEFDPNKSFSLQNASELGADIRSDSITSKMVVLTMHFPKLRILWSRSPYETYNIFHALKMNHDEVNVEKAIEIGQSESIETLLQGDQQQLGVADDDEDEFNEVARDMLLRLPGVNVQSARRIMQNVDSLAELSSLDREELRRIAGPITGQKLYTFFRQNFDSS